MPASIFSTYSTGENRVTASILAVLKSLSLGRIERLLGAVLEQSEFELIHFRNQVASGGKGVPDAEIRSSCRILIETKIKRDSVSVAQLERHLEKLNGGPEAHQVLLVLTPDDRRPHMPDELDDGRLVWSSFSALNQSIEELLADSQEVVSEREAFLLRELQNMLVEERLIGTAKEVVVVPAHRAWPQYQRYHAYICQPNRTFQPVQYVAFYCGGHIQPLVPQVLKVWDEVVYGDSPTDRDLAKVVEAILQDQLATIGISNKIMMLTAPDDPRTLKLEFPIPNALKADSGQTIAFTQNQRYVGLARLRKARTTADLIGD